MEGPAFPQPDAQENVPSAALESVRKCWAEVLAGNAEEEDLALTLQAFWDRVQFELNSLDAQVVQGVSNPKDPTFAAIYAGFEKQMAAAERMELELEQPDQGHMEAGLQLAQNANNMLAQAHRALLERLEASARVDCPFCSSSNPRTETRCGQCLRPLPQLAEEAPTSSFSLLQAEGLQARGQGRPFTQNAQELTQALEDYQQERLTWEQLYTVLDEIEEKLMRHQEENQKLFVEGEGDPGGLFHRTDEALHRSLEALDTMRLAWDQEDESFLQRGLDQFYAASDELLEVFEAMKEKAEAA